jgi:pyruvate/2-oxoglutarate dehydrogenase complex dihydrolipoamide acyltransferase (E2) component
MKSAVVSVLVGVMALGLAGCGSTMRSYLEKETPTQAVSVGQDLTMPPDLRLPPPSSAAAAPAPAVTSTQAALVSPSAPATAGATPAAPAADGVYSVYTNAGISLYNADGTKKTDQQLREELQAYYTAQKKAKNPNYGTVFNIGNIFKDE